MGCEYDLDNYEAESDGVGWWSKSPVGYGSTESEAIADLMNQINRAAPAARAGGASALNAVIGALDVVASMALDPQDYDEVARGENRHRASHHPRAIDPLAC